MSYRTQKNALKAFPRGEKGRQGRKEEEEEEGSREGRNRRKGGTERRRKKRKERRGGKGRVERRGSEFGVLHRL